MSREKIVIIGAGLGGLSAALDLAQGGADVTVLEKSSAPGGKMREIVIGDARLDAGPTVFTMRWVFEALFADAGETLSSHLTLRQADVLARHAWSETERLDLFANTDRSANAIGDFAGADEARGFRDFSARAKRIYETLETPFIKSPQPSPVGLVTGAGFGGLGDLWSISPFTTLWSALGQHFRDPRVRQLFGRYATYCGSSPYDAPATLMLVAHVESAGVWMVEGGMHRVAQAIARLATARGATFRYGAEVCEILVKGGKACGVRLADGEEIAADAVLVNADPAAVASGLFGDDAARATPTMKRRDRSLSAITWSVVAETGGFPLIRHNVFFSGNYRAEFDAIFRERRVPNDPTVYVCALDRGDAATMTGPERLLVLVNAPPDGDLEAIAPSEIESCASRTFDFLSRCGLTLSGDLQARIVTTPADFERLFPGTGGALYGRSSHGWTASFARPAARSRLPGLYLAGGATHPGPGAPMATLSGRMAAAAIRADLTSRRPSRKTAMSGGMSTP